MLSEFRKNNRKDVKTSNIAKKHAEAERIVLSLDNDLNVYYYPAHKCILRGHTRAFGATAKHVAGGAGKGLTGAL